MSKKNPALTRPNYSEKQLARGDIPFAHLKNHEIRHILLKVVKALKLENGSIADRLFTEISMRLRGATDTSKTDVKMMHYIRVIPQHVRKFNIGDLVEVKREFRYGNFFTKSDIWRSGVVVGYGNTERSNEYKIDYHDVATRTDYTARENHIRLAVNPSID